MRKALSISLVLAVALAGSAFAKPVDTTGDLDKFQYLDLNNPAQNLKGSSQSGVFGSAQASTTYFGGTTWDAAGSSTGGIGAGGQWEAMPDSCWTFDTGVGSSFSSTVATGAGSYTIPINPFKDASLHTISEGWIGYDNSFGGVNPYYRLLDVSDFPGTFKCVGTANGLEGSGSFWCGVIEGAEADGLCYAGGQGYGNSWVVSIEQTFAYTGGNVALSFDYFSDTEAGFDYNYVVVDTSGLGDNVVVASYNGVIGNGSESLNLTPGVDLPSSNGNIIIRFQTVADGAYSDEDGLDPTDCGAFAVDNINITGGVTHAATFEGVAQGWALSPPAAGQGGEWSDIVALSDLPPYQTPCTCDLTDTVLTLIDITQGGGSGGHGLFQDNLAASPWIDLAQHGLAGSPGKFIQTNIYAELALLNYLFVQFNVQWYPQVCAVTGGLITSPFTSNGFVYFFGGVPQCTTPGASGNPGSGIGTRIEFSEVMDPGAEQVRIALGVIAYCRFFGNCTGVTNPTPWFDYSKMGVYGDPDAPFLNASTIDLPFDSFPQNGTLRLDAAGRVDCNNTKGFSQPEPFSTIGDTLIVAGGLPGGGSNVGAEVYATFSVRPGPGDAGALAAWAGAHAGSHPDFPVFNWLQDGHGNALTWYTARMDTSKQGEVNNNATWMTAYHESDPLFSGTDIDTDANDLDPLGLAGRKANDMFPEGTAGIFVPGTRLNIFYQTRYVGVGGLPTTGTVFTFPDTNGGAFLEMEVLPASAASDSTWNCVLYVDHFDGRGAQPFIESALQTTLGGGSNNFENVPWDRWDVRAPSSQQASFGRPLNSDYGATVNQTFAYKMIVWNSGNLGAFNIVDEDANVLRPWLNLTDAGLGFNNFYASGDGVAQSVTGEAASEPNALQLLNVDMGVVYTCGTVRDPGCGSANAKNEACMDLDPVGGFAGNDGTHFYGGNFCPQLRSFDVVTPALGSGAFGDEEYNTSDGVIQYAAVGRTAAGGPDFNTMLDGGSIHYREAAGCDGTGDQPQVDDRMNRVLSAMGYGSAASCVDPLAALDIPGPRDGGNSGFVTALAAGRPNPFQGRGVVTLGFSLGSKGAATLEVFDVSGRLVKTVIDNIYEAGSYEVSWDATDNSGSSVASGVYFYRLRANGDEFAKKLVVVKNGN